MPNHLGQHAVVIGGSLAGLMTARVLADYFDAVTVLERDYINEQPALHQSIPQGNHLHSLLPFYGQGMSSAALQVQALQQLSAEREAGPWGLDGLALSFFPKAAEIIDTPWALAVGRDFAYPGTHGRRPADLDERTQYFADVDALTAEDLEVHRLVVEAFNLVKPLSALDEEPLRSRVEARQQKNKK